MLILAGASIAMLTGNGTSYTIITKFQETMQKDYNEIVKSVEYYGGFWIGRYESSLVGGKKINLSKRAINLMASFLMQKFLKNVEIKKQL